MQSRPIVVVLICKLRNLFALWGQTSMNKCNLRIQGRMQIFRQMSQKALNRDLTLPFYGRGPALQSPQQSHGFTKQKHIRGDKTLKL